MVISLLPGSPAENKRAIVGLQAKGFVHVGGIPLASETLSLDQTFLNEMLAVS